MSTSQRLLSIPFAFGCALALACASGSGGAASEPQARPSRNSDVITHQELADPALAGGTLLDAIQRLRPRFVADRGGAIGGVKEPVQISINGGDPTALGDLARIGISEVTEVRYLSTADAQLRFGLRGSMGPVLLVTTTPR
jgi:hypothetical protein